MTSVFFLSFLLLTPPSYSPSNPFHASQLKLTVSEQTLVPEWASQFSPPWGFLVETETDFQWNEVNVLLSVVVLIFPTKYINSRLLLQNSSSVGMTQESMFHQASQYDCCHCADFGKHSFEMAWDLLNHGIFGAGLALPSRGHYGRQFFLP